MTKNGFKLMKNGSSEAIYKRKTILGYDIFGSSSAHYGPIQVFGFGVSKFIKPIEDITKEINKHIQLSPPITKNTRSLALTNHKLDADKQTKRVHRPETTEEDAKEYVEEVIEHLENVDLPLLYRFNDLREIDKVINGDNFWRDDWQREFGLGGNFTEKQFIIAKLVGGQKHLDEVIEKHRAASIKYWAEKDEVVNCPYLTNIETSIGFTIKYLKNVEAIY